MLHVTNGDCAAARIEALHLGGDVLPWRDVLHEGPVPAPATLDSLRPLRARFLAFPSRSPVEVARELEARDRRLGAEREEVTLWFERDLYDQLQLAQILEAFNAFRRAGLHGPPRLTLIQSDDDLGCMDAARLRALWGARSSVTAAQLDAARRAWQAFASPDPRAIEAVLDEVGALPFMRAALARHLEEFPSVKDGLSRTERQALDALAAGSRRVRELFTAAHHDREEAIFLGDLVFIDLLTVLASGETPLVRINNDVASLTSAGREVLEGTRDRVETLGLDRWLGGVRLKGRRPAYRWDSHARRIVTA